MEDIQTQLDQCKLLLDRAEVGLWEADFVQRSYICSDYLMSIFGKKGNNLSFFEFYYIIREDFRDLITTDFLSIQSVDTNEQIFPIITPTGEKWVRSRLCERKLNNGVCVKALGILQILPNFKLKEEKISKMIDHNEMIFRKLYVNLPVGVELYDRDGYLIDLNAKDMEIFGIRSKKDVLGVNIFSNPILPKDVIKKLKENKSVNFRLNYSFKKVDDYYNTSKVGELDIVTKASILYDQRGEPSSYLLINLDNTEKMIAYNRISEFENVIRVFNEKYGATFDSASTRINDMGICGAFGAYAGFSVNTNYGYYVHDGKVGLGAADDGWRDYVSWMNKMWSEGLLDQDMLTEDDTTIKDKIHNEKCGVSYTSMGQLNIWNKEEEAAGNEGTWIGIPYPTADDGSLSAVFGGPGVGKHTTVITKTADEDTMKLCLQMLNYAYTEEGMLYWNYGDEGVSWEYDEDGVPQFTSLVKDDPDTDPMTKYNGATWGSCCIQATNLLYQKNSQTAIDANNTWFYIDEDEEKNREITSGWRYPVGISFTIEESDKLDEISQNIPTFVNESYASFLTGAKDINDDAVWEQYQKDLESYNLSEILEIRQAAYDRYLAR